MAEKTMPAGSSNMEKAEGDRWSSEEDTVEKADRNSYPPDEGDDAGGISNRPFDEELENQESLPERGKSQSEEQTRSNEDLER